MKKSEYKHITGLLLLSMSYHVDGYEKFIFLALAAVDVIYSIVLNWKERGK